MPGVIFTHTLRHNWRQILYWGLFMGILGFYIVFFIKDVEIIEQYSALLGAFPPAILQFIGVSDPEALTTPEGFIGFGLFGFAVLILAVYAVSAGMSITANEEDDGTLDILLSLPVARWRVVLEKFAAHMLIAVGILALAFVITWIGTFTAPELELDIGRIMAGIVNMLPVILLMIALTLFLTTTIRSRSLATSLTAGIIVGSYFLDDFGAIAAGSVAEIVGRFSFFHYYDGTAVMIDGLNIANMLLLLGTGAALVIGSLWTFDRRDIGL